VALAAGFLFGERGVSSFDVRSVRIGFFFGGEFGRVRTGFDAIRRV